MLLRSSTLSLLPFKHHSFVTTTVCKTRSWHSSASRGGRATPDVCKQYSQAHWRGSCCADSLLTQQNFQSDGFHDDVAVRLDSGRTTGTTTVQGPLQPQDPWRNGGHRYDASPLWICADAGFSGRGCRFLRSRMQVSQGEEAGFLGRGNGCNCIVAISGA